MMRQHNIPRRDSPAGKNRLYKAVKAARVENINRLRISTLTGLLLTAMTFVAQAQKRELPIGTVRGK
jgi:hypothetical protein